MFYYDRTLEYYTDITEQGMSMPMIAYAYQRTIDTILVTSISVGINNRHDPAGHIFLQPLDTFAFQEFEILFQKE